LVCGIAPFNLHLVILAYIEDTEAAVDLNTVAGRNGIAQKQAQRPELRVVSYTNQEVASDALPIHGFQHYTPNDYSLEFLPGFEPLFYVVSPKDIVLARPRDLDDRVSWLLSRSRFKEALETADSNQALLRQHKFMDIGEKYLTHLFEIRDYETAAAACPRLLSTNAELWESWILLFVKERQTRCLSQYIPTSNPVLNTRTYEMLLSCFLAEDAKLLLSIIKKWDQKVYCVDNVIQAVLYKLEELKAMSSQSPSTLASSSTSTSVTSSAPASHSTHMNIADRLSSITGGGGNNGIGSSNANVIANAEMRVLLEVLGELYIMNKQFPEALQIYLETGKHDT
jgi:hypothetical protein